MFVKYGSCGISCWSRYCGLFGLEILYGQSYPKKIIIFFKKEKKTCKFDVYLSF